MWPAIIAYAKTQFDDAEEDYVDGLDKELQMSVPLLWYPSSNKIMSEAAELASLPRTELVLEPIAAAACVLDAITANSWNKSKFDLKRLAKGKLIQVVDLGGGTCVRIKRPTVLRRSTNKHARTMSPVGCPRSRPTAPQWGSR